jgi:hypothetical protein
VNTFLTLEINADFTPSHCSPKGRGPELRKGQVRMHARLSKFIISFPNKKYRYLLSKYPGMMPSLSEPAIDGQAVEYLRKSDSPSMMHDELFTLVFL